VPPFCRGGAGSPSNTMWPGSRPTSNGLATIHQRYLKDVTSKTTIKSSRWLDRFWMNQDVKYDFTADLIGTGDRSECQKNVKRSFISGVM